MVRWVLAFAMMLAVFILPPAGSWAADDENADPPVQYRIDIMKGIGANAAAIGVTLRYQLPQTQNIALHAEAISRDARAALTAFEPKIPGGAAKPEVWDKWQDFSARLTKLADAADAAAKAAHDQSPDAKDKLNDMFSTCKSCHDTYRKK